MNSKEAEIFKVGAFEISETFFKNVENGWTYI
jgi:hypothetical protein